MTVVMEPTARACESAQAQINQWFALGLPKGDVIFNGSQTVRIAVEQPWEVDAWARAMGITATRYTHTYATGCQRPAGLPGWELDVWCWAPAYVAPRIPLAGAR